MKIGFDAFPEIMFTLDLMDDDKNRGETKDMFWSKIQEQIINLISKGGMKSGEINYDTDRSKVQVKSGVFKGGHSLEGYEFVDCDFSGSIKNCDFYNCRFTNSDIETSNLYQGCKVSDSKIK